MLTTCMISSSIVYNYENKEVLMESFIEKILSRKYGKYLLSFKFLIHVVKKLPIKGETDAKQIENPWMDLVLPYSVLFPV